MESLYYYYFMLNYFLPIWTHKVGLSSFWRTAYCWRIKPLKNLVQLALNRAEGFKNEHDVWYPFISHWPLYLYLLWISVSLVWPSIIRFSLSLTITILLSIAATRSDNWKKNNYWYYSKLFFLLEDNEIIQDWQNIGGRYSF